MKKMLYVLVGVIFVSTLLFASCSSSKMEMKEDSKHDYGAMPKVQKETMAGMPGNNSGEDQLMNKSEDSAPRSNIEETRKIIKTGRIRVETTEFDNSVKALLDLVDDYGAYVYSSEFYNGNPDDPYDNKHCDYIIKVPAQHFDEFMNSSSNVGSIINKSESKDDVTASYRDVEARLKSLRVQEERLLDILSKADDLEAIIKLESALSEVRYQIENFESSKRLMDDQVSYSKINIRIREVVMLREFRDKPITFGEKIGYALSNSLENTVVFLQEAVIFIIYALPTFIILALIVFVIIKIVKKVKKRNQVKVEENTDINIELGEGKDKK